MVLREGADFDSDKLKVIVGYIDLGISKSLVFGLILLVTDVKVSIFIISYC